MRRFLPFVLPVLLLLSACQREAGDDPLRLTGRMFVFNYRLAYATYLITLEREAAVPEGTVVRAEFENPAGGPPLALEHRLFPALRKVVLESPDLTCVKKDRPYAVSIAVIGPGGETLQALETTVTSSLDQSALPEKPLVIGPGYDRNPEAYKDGGTPKGFDMAACPA